MKGLRDCVLVVDDEVLIAELWCMMLEEMGMTVCGRAATAASAIAMARTFRPKVVLMDVRLRGELDGVDAALAIQQATDSRVIFITGSKEPSTTARIELGHPAAVLFKPVSERQLQVAVRAAMA
jgi:CheY-like chemotaxis protein